jgi:hypothetical protein
LSRLPPKSKNKSKVKRFIGFDQAKIDAFVELPHGKSTPTFDTKQLEELWRSSNEPNSFQRPQDLIFPEKFEKRWKDIFSGTMPLQFNAWVLEVKNTLPKEAKLVDAWCIPVGQVTELPNVSGVEINSEDPSAIELTCDRPIPEKLSYKVYILYRTPLPPIAFN